MTTGVEVMPPIGPRLEIVKVAPLSSSRVALPVRAASDEAANFRGQLPDDLGLGVADDRDHQPVRRLRRHAHVNSSVAGHDHRFVVEGRVEHRPVGKRPGHCGDQEREQRQLRIVAAVAVHHLPRFFERGDVELLDQGEVLNAAVRLRHVLGDLAAQADDLDRLVLCAALQLPRLETLPPL